MRLYFLIFWIPAVTSAVQLLIARASGMLQRPGVNYAWFFVALTFQVTGQLFSPIWAIGLACQTILAIYLTIRLQAQY